MTDIIEPISGNIKLRSKKIVIHNPSGGDKLVVFKCENVISDVNKTEIWSVPAEDIAFPINDKTVSRTIDYQDPFDSTQTKQLTVADIASAIEALFNDLYEEK